jgi:hypothetical protein
MIEVTPTTRVIKAAILVTANTRPKDISRCLDEAFEDWDEVLQFVVEGAGWEKDEDATHAALTANLADSMVDE